MPQAEKSTLFELLPVGAYRSAPDGTILRANSALARLNGYASEAEMRADTRNQGRDPYVAPGRRAQFRALLEGEGQVRNFESELVRFNAEGHMWVREHAHAVRDANGKMLYFEGTVEDITEERAAKELLHQREAMLHGVLQTIPDQVWLKDIDGVFLTCNEAFAHNLGTVPEDIVGTRDADWLPPEAVAHFLETDRLAMQAGKAVMFEESLMSGVDHVGDQFEVVKIPMHDSQGNVIGVLGMGRNVQERKAAEARLRDTTEQLELAIMGADLGRWEQDLSLDRGYRMDTRACQMLGRDAAQSSQFLAWGELIHPDDLQGALQAMRSHLQGHTAAYAADYRAQHSDGRWIWLSSRGKVVQTDKAGKPLRMVGTVMDVSDRKQSELRLRSIQAELQATLNALPDALFELTVDGVYRAVHSPENYSLTRPAEFFLDKQVNEILPKDAADTCMAALHEADITGRSTGKQYSLELSDGKRWFELSVARKPTEPGEERRFIAITRDITERKEAEEAIRHLAFHDSLTDLPNRRLLGDRLQQAVTASIRQHQYAALLFLDLDQFKQLNDTRGHDIGDLLLKEVAHRLKLCVRAVDTVARLGGDEFVVLIQDLGTDIADARLHAATVGHKILSSLNQPYTLDGVTAQTTPSIGITLFNGPDASPGDILKQADQAMYEAKAQGRNTLVFYTHNPA